LVNAVPMIKPVSVISGSAVSPIAKHWLMASEQWNGGINACLKYLMMN